MILRTLSALCLLFWAALASAQVSIVSPFLGTWENTARGTRHVTRLEITQVAGAIKVHAWHAARPIPFDGGVVDATLHLETTPPGAPRRRGVVLRSPADARASTGNFLLIEQGGAGLLTVTYFLIGGDGPTFERMTFRRFDAGGDCLAYNPATVTLAGERIMAGSTPLLAFDDPRDRDLGMALARSYARYCTIGRGNTRTDRLTYVFEYWEGGAGGATAPTSDCTPYDPARLRITNLGADGFRLDWPTTSGVVMLQMFDTLADATAGLAVFRRHTRQCFIGRGSASSAAPRPAPYQYLK